MFHVAETLEWGHRMVLDTVKVGLVRILDIQVAARRLASAYEWFHHEE